MSSEQKNRNTPLILAVILLAVVFAAGGILLLSGWQPAAVQPESEAFTLPETTAVQRQTTAAATEEIVQTTVTTAEPDPHAAYQSYLENTLLPECGSADFSAAVPCSKHCGIAGVFFADLRDTGTDDMVVIRLDITDGNTAAQPVFLWYGETADGITLLDSFEVKPQWSAYCIRREGKELYLSGEYSGETGAADTWQFTEIRIAFRPDPDLTLLDMEQGTLAERPAALYPDSAELLLEMQLDTAQPLTPAAERRYILRSYVQLPQQAEEVPAE